MTVAGKQNLKELRKCSGEGHFCSLKESSTTFIGDRCMGAGEGKVGESLGLNEK